MININLKQLKTIRDYFSSSKYLKLKLFDEGWSAGVDESGNGSLINFGRGSNHHPKKLKFIPYNIGIKVAFIDYQPDFKMLKKVTKIVKELNKNIKKIKF